MTLSKALDASRGVGPGFHMLRHLLSFVILAHHCRIAVRGIETSAGYAKGMALTSSSVVNLSQGEMIVELLRPGLYALVGMFFALSGFLVAGSAFRNPRVGVFFANRALRIIPALSVEVFLSALLLGPLVTNLPLPAYFTDWQFFRYFGNIIGDVTFELPGVFLANPWPKMVNANLWTLPPEFWCYALMLAMMLTGVILHHKRMTIAISTAFILALLLTVYDPVTYSVKADSTHFTSWYIVMIFFFGVLFQVNAKYIVLSPWLFAGAALGYYILTAADKLGIVSGLLLTYCTVYIGMQNFRGFDRLVTMDLSYGTYLYGFPITQLVTFFMVPHLHHISPVLAYLIIFPAVVVLTVLFSALSWTYIEKPALGLRKRFLPAEAKLPAAGIA